MVRSLRPRDLHGPTSIGSELFLPISTTARFTEPRALQRGVFLRPQVIQNLRHSVFVTSRVT